jgi:hypothetical protein
MDFSAILANMESKRSALDAAIASLRAAMASGALGTVGTSVDTIPVDGIPITVASQRSHGIDIPNGAFHGKTVTEAIKTYLGTIKKKQKTRQIVDALRKGGIESSSDKFSNIVYNNLARMQNITGEIVKVGTEWGLSEWFPAGMRSSAKPPAVRRKRKRPTYIPGAVKKVISSHSGASTLPARIEELLGTDPDKVYTPAEIATVLNVAPISVNVRLKRLLTRGRVSKEGHGQYRAANPVVPKRLL